jgi:serine/threonine protein kinase
MAEREANLRPLIIGRYELHSEIASGGMATVHLGRIVSDAGFSRVVAIKRLHPHLARDPTFSAMFIDEARLASHIQHPNVVSTLDVVATEGELFVVMEYVRGASLWKLIRLTNGKNGFLPLDVVCTIGVGVLDGLHAAHEAKNQDGQPLGIVHRDVSPQNVLVGLDGVPRVIDFGVAKAAGRQQSTHDGKLKGKLGYMPPEQFDGRPPDRRGDVYSASVVLWEMLTGQRLFEGLTEGETFRKVIVGPPEPPSTYAPPGTEALDDIVMRGLARDPADRFATARDMALAIERASTPALTRRVGEWVAAVAGDALDIRAQPIAEAELQRGSNVYVAPHVDDDRTEVRPTISRTSATFTGATLEFVAGAAGERGPKVGASPGDSITTIRESTPRSDPDPEPAAETLGEWGMITRKQSAPRDSSDETPKEHVARLDVPTPLHPIRPSSIPPPPSSAPAPPPPPSVRPARRAGGRGPSSRMLAIERRIVASLLGAAWTEERDGVAWKVVFRPASLWLAGAIVVLALTVLGFVMSQREGFGVGGVLAVIGVIVGACVLVLRMVRAAHFRFDPENVSIELWPSGHTTTIPTRRIERFVVTEAARGEVPAGFYVHVLLVEGAPERLEVEFDTEAEARRAMKRFNEMLFDVRDASAPVRA